MYLSVVVLLVSGIITGVTGNWWGRGWIWASRMSLIAIIVAMMALGLCSILPTLCVTSLKR